jgi:hypothetical protein
VATRSDVRGPGVRSLPEPHHLGDIDVDSDGEVAHQHVNRVYVGRADARRIQPAGVDEAPPDR